MPDSDQPKDSSLKARQTRFMIHVLRSRKPPIPAYHKTAKLLEDSLKPRLVGSRPPNEVPKSSDGFGPGR